MSCLNQSKLRVTGLSACVAILFACLLAAGTAQANANTDPTGAPSITGTPLEGRTLTADIAGIADADGIDFATLMYQWVSNDGMADSDIEEATAATYVVRAADVGNTLKVRVTFTDNGGTVETLTSAATTAVVADNTPPALVGQKIANGWVVLEFSEELKSADPSPPSPYGSAISITVDGVSRSVRGWFFVREEGTVFLSLSLPVQSGEATVVSYTPPATNPIQDLAGNLAAAFSVTIPASVTASVPAAPSGLEANAGATYVKLSWKTPDNGGKTLTGYEYRQKEGANAFGTWTAVANSGPDTRGYTVRSLTSDTEYTFEVRAKNGAGDGAAASISATPSTTETVAPTLVRQRIELRHPVLRFSEDLVWSSRPDPSAFAVKVDGVTRNVTSVSIGAETGTVALRLSLPVLSGETTVISYTPPATAYLRDLAGNAVAAFSVTIHASGRGTAPGALRNLAAKAGTAQVTLTWGRTYNGNKTITGFEYRQKEGTNAFGTWTAVPNSGPNTRSYTVGSLTSDTEYTFEVRAKNRAGDGEEASVSATPSATETVPPALVTAVKADDHLRFVFDEVLDGDSVPAASAFAVTVEDVSTDVIKVAVDGSKRTVRLEIAAQIRWSRDSIAVSYTPPETNPIKDLAGNAAAAFTTQAIGRTVTAPDAPRDLEAESGDGEVTLTWREPYDGGERIIGYEYRQKEGSDAFGNWMSMPFSGTTLLKGNYTVSGLTNSTQYTFEVRADNGADKGPAASASATPEPLAPLTDTVPRAPRITRLYVDYGKLTVTGEVSLGIAVPVERLSSVVSSFKVQWKSGSEDYDSTRETVLTPSPGSSGGSHSMAFLRSYDITGLTNGVGYTVRIIATNAYGDSAPSAERTATPNAKPDQLRQYIENDVVEEHESSFPWLRDVWEYMERRNVALYVRSSGNSHIQTYCPNGGLSACYVSSMTVTTSVIDGDADAKKRTILHELAHVYTLANGVSSTPAPIAMGHLYFASVGGQGCSSTELYADILASLVLGGSTTSASYWNSCSGATDSATALAVVRSAAAGQTPAWFATTYNDTDEDPDLEKVWADLIAMGTPNYLYIARTQKAVAYQLRSQFGGYCDSATAARAIEWETEARAVTKNPWKDGGCVPHAPGSPTGTPGGSRQMVVSWEAPDSDGGSRIRGYKVQWKSGSEDYGSGSGRQKLVLFDSYASVRPTKVSETVTGLTDGTEYTFRVFAFNQNGDGAAVEVAATPSATDAAAPELLTATVTRKNLVLNYNEALDETSSPAESAYAVTVAGNARAVSNVSVAESAVTLVLSSKVAKGEAVKVSYTVPTDANDPRIKDATGNDAAAFSGQAVTNNTPPVSTDATLDSISYSSAFQPCENDRRIHCPRPHGGLGTYFSSISMDVDSATDTITFWPHPANDQATVAYNPQDADAKADGYQLSLSTGQNLATFTVTAEDGVTTRTYSVTVTRTGNLPRLWVANDGATEGHDGVLEFPVWLSPASTSEVTVNYATSDGTATEGDDYRATSGKLTFNAGNVLTYVRVPIIDDTVPDSGETLTLTLSDPEGATLAKGYETATGTIWNSEATVLSVADALGSESDGSIAFEVTLNQAAESEVTVDYTTADGTATAGEDYTKTSGALTFAVGDTSKTLSVPVTADEVEEGDETLTLVLTNPSGAGIAHAVATGTIGESEAVPGNSEPTGLPVITGTAQVDETLTASVDGIEDADGLTGVTFAYQWVSNDGTTDRDIEDADEAAYTPVTADVGKTLKVRVTFTDNGKTEETLTSATTAVVAPALPSVSLRAVKAYVTEGANAAFALSRTGDVSSVLTVAVAVTADGVALDGEAPSSAEFASGVREVTLAVATADDDSPGSDGTVTANLAAGTGYEVAADGGPASVTVLDDDAAAAPEGTVSEETLWSGTATISGSGYISSFSDVAGTGGFGVRSIWYSRGAEKLSLRLSSRLPTVSGLKLHLDGRAIALPSGSGGKSSVKFTIEGLVWTEGEEVSIRITRPSAVGALSDAALASLALGDATLNPTFDAETLFYAVSVESSVERVTVTVEPRDGDADVAFETVDADGETSGHQVALGYGETLVTARVTSSDGEAERAYRVVVTRARPADVEVTFGAASYSAVEGGAAAEVVVSLSADPGKDVTIPLTSTPGGGAEAGDYSAQVDVVFTSGGALSQTIEVTAVSDEVAEDGESVTLSFGELPDGVVVGTTRSTTVALRDAEASNTEPTGLPVISGIAQVGQVLTASVDGIEDADGLKDVTFAHQWVSNDGNADADIEDADEVTYTPVAADLGKTLKVRVTFTDNGKNEQTLTSAATAAVAPVTVSFAAAAYMATEGSSVEVEVSLSGDPGTDVTIPLSATPEGGAQAEDYTVAESVTFTSGGALTQTIEVTAVADEAAEAGESVALDFGELPDGVVAGATAQATVALADAGPVAAVLSVGGAPAQAGRFQVRAAFAQAVTGFAADDLEALRVGGDAASVSDVVEAETGRAWTAWVAAPEAGRYVVRLGAGAARSGDRESAAAVLAVDVDAEGNAVAVAGPAVSAVSVAAPGGGALFWGPGDDIEVTLGFTEAVTVDTAGGTPTVGLTVGGTARTAPYASGTGTASLTFAYRVTAQDGTVSAVEVTASSLAVNGATIRDGAGRAADLAHPGASRGLAGEPEAPAEPLLGFTLVDAASATDVGSIADGGAFTLDDPANGSYGIRVETAEGAQVGSVKLALVAGAKAVTRTDNLAPWSLYGDANGAVHGQGLPAGSYTLTATAHAQADGTGAVLQTLGVSFTVTAEETPAGDALTAAFRDVPAEHGGPDSEPFTFQVLFSEAIPVSYRVLRDQGAFTVVNGTVKKARRVDGRDDLREIHIQPSGWDAVTVTLPATTDCAATGAICMGDERMLSNTQTATVEGPVAIDVADAKVTEGPGATLDFVVSLSRASDATVTVDYATADGTATEGDDYTRTDGTLTFEAGQTEKTVAVPVLDDAHDDDGETMTLVLSNAVGARIRDGEAVGTIENSDAIPKAWLARFGRTVADHVVDAVGSRLAGPAQGGSHVTLGGQRIALDGAGAAGSEKEAQRALAGREAREGLAALADRMAGASSGDGAPGANAWTLRGEEEPGGDTRTMTGRELLLGSSFHLALGADGESAGAADTRWTAWGRAASSRFDGEADGLVLDGEVTTFTLGADAAWSRWLAGVAVSLSEGEGTYRDHETSNHASRGSGKLESSLTGVHPYARLTLSERLSAWGLLGFGAGELTLEVDSGERWTTDTAQEMAAAGARGVLVAAPEAGGLELALRADAVVQRMRSDAATSPRLAASEAQTSRVRLMLEGSHAIAVGDGGRLVPTLEVGLRQDGGDAETGTGIELGGGLAWTDPATGLAVEAKVRGLVAHEDADYGEWGAGGSVRIAPGADGRGLTLTLAPAWGAAEGGAERLWSHRDARAFAPEGETEAGAGSRLEAELGYGFAVLGGRAVATPWAGMTRSETDETLRLGQRLTMGASQWSLESAFGAAGRSYSAGYGYRVGPSLDLTLEASRREAANDNAPEHEIMLRAGMRW